MRVSFCAPRPDRPVATLLANCGGCLRCIRRSLLRLRRCRLASGRSGTSGAGTHWLCLSQLPLRPEQPGPGQSYVCCFVDSNPLTCPPTHTHSRSQPASSPLRGRLRGSVPLPDRSVVDGGRVFARRGIVNLRMGQGSRHGRARNAPLRPSLCPLLSAAWRASGCREMGMASRAPPPSTSSPRCRCSRGWRSSRLTP